MKAEADGDKPTDSALLALRERDRLRRFIVNGSDGLALRRPFRQVAPSFETLETRFCPTVSVVASGHTLLIQGDDSANRVSITDNGSGQVTAEISSPTDQTSLTADGIDTIQVNAGNGDDTVDYSLRGNLVQNLNLVVRLGAGNDRVDTSLLPDISSGRVNIDIAKDRPRFRLRAASATSSTPR